MASVSGGTVSAVSPLENAFNSFKNILSFEYMNGERGEYRNRSFQEKIVNQPGRALITAAVACGTAWVVKKLFDLAQKHGIFDEINRPAQFQPGLQQPRVGQVPPVNFRNQQPVHGPNNARPANQPNYRPGNQRPANRPNNNPQVNQPVHNFNNVPVAGPFNGNQLNILGLNLPGFYHMTSHTPYHGVHNACGVNAAFNMALVEAQLFGRPMDNERFREAQRAIFPGMGGRGASNHEVQAMVNRMGLAQMTLLLQNRPNVGGINGRAYMFRNTQGPRVAHFLCQVPGHWIAISVVRNQFGELAMYLYDNMNGAARNRDAMRRHVENVYNAFFN